MRIIAAQRLRRSLYALTIETVGEVQVDVRTFDESPYRVGGEITQTQLDCLLEQAQYNRARDKALYLLGLRDYGCRELERKLTPEYPPRWLRRWWRGWRRSACWMMCSMPPAPPAA